MGNCQMKKTTRRGRCSPTVDQLEEVAARCGVTADWLTGRDLIEEALEEQAQDSFICLMGRPLERLRLEDLEAMRESVLGVIQMKREGLKPAVVTFPPVPATGRGEAFVLLEAPDSE